MEARIRVDTLYKEREEKGRRKTVVTGVEVGVEIGEKGRVCIMIVRIRKKMTSDVHVA
jgi:hypothetical protein